MPRDLVIRTPLARVAGALVLALTLSGCLSPVLNDEAIEANIREEVPRQANVNLTEVDCPDDRPIRQGDVFECTAITEDGRTLTITVTQNDDQGNVNWEVTGETGPEE
jgi:hypothetical protein